jgi:hypothetical protein
VFDNPTSPRRPIAAIEFAQDWFADQDSASLLQQVGRKLAHHLTKKGWSKVVLTGGSTSEIARVWPETMEYLKDLKQKPILVSRCRVDDYGGFPEALACAVFMCVEMCVKEAKRQELPSKEKVQREYPEVLPGVASYYEPSEDTLGVKRGAA